LQPVAACGRGVAVAGTAAGLAGAVAHGVPAKALVVAWPGHRASGLSIPDSWQSDEIVNDYIDCKTEKYYGHGIPRNSLYFRFWLCSPNTKHLPSSQAGLPLVN
jgi:hypothetical protein